MAEGRCARKRKRDVGKRMGTLEDDEKDGNIDQEFWEPEEDSTK